MGTPIKTCTKCGREFVNEKDFFANTTRWRVCNQGHLWFNCACESTLIILKGKFDFYSPDKVMSRAGRSVFNRLANKENIPYIPNAITELQSLLNDENSTAVKLAEMIKKEPLIAGELLTVANNMKVASGREIQSIEHAVTYAGRPVVSELVLLATIKSFPFYSEHFKPEDFWDSAIKTGLIAEILAKKIGNKDIAPEHAYLAGALCNVGKVIAAICYPDEADRISRAIDNRATLSSWRSAEQTTGLVDHTILGEIAGVLWGMPTFVADAAKNHERMTTESVELGLNLSDIAGLANQVSHWLKLQPHRMNQDLIDQILERLGMSNSDFEKMVESIGEDISARTA